jgi:phosphohistidine phosphatase
VAFLPRTIVLVRHAIAAERGDAWPDDALRPLTERGVSRFKVAARGLAWLDLDIEEVWTSPLVRARQTADLLAAALGGPPVRTLDSLTPGGTPASVARAIESATRGSRLALVGHEPDVGALASWWLGSARGVAFKKGGACRIDVGALSRPGSGELAWCLPPRLLRRLADASVP